MMLKRKIFVRQIYLVLLLAYGMVADPRMAWALGMTPASGAAHACDMINCHCQHGNGAHSESCCVRAVQRLEGKYPGLQAFMRRLEAQENALPEGGSRMKAANCVTGSSDEAPAPGRPHTLATALGLGLVHPLVEVRLRASNIFVEPRGEALLKVPWI